MQSLPPAYITASLHTEHVNTTERMEEFANKLSKQEHDVLLRPNMVMVSRNGLNETEECPILPCRGINVTPNPVPIQLQMQSLKDTQKNNSKDWNGMPQRVTQKAKGSGKKGPKSHSQSKE